MKIRLTLDEAVGFWLSLLDSPKLYLIARKLEAATPVPVGDHAVSIHTSAIALKEHAEFVVGQQLEQGHPFEQGEVELDLTEDEVNTLRWEGASA